MSFFTNQVYLQFVDAARDISVWLLLLTLFGFHKIPKWRRWTIALSILYVLSQIIDMIALARWETAGLGTQWVDAITTAIYSLTPLYIFFIVGVGLLRKRQTEMLPVGIAAFLYGLWTFLVGILGQGNRFTHWTIINPLQAWGLHLGDYTFSARFLLDSLLFLILLYTVTLQEFLERRRQAQIELEMRSACEAQHVLIPEETPPIPGLSIASVYKPAAEVGGDFFQVIPLAASEKNPGALIILGDVSGKGLKAAMTVSLIVGTLRTLAQYTEQPSEILRDLNQRLMGRTERGFTTCLVLRIQADGACTLANAGHLPPFCDGKELAVLDRCRLASVRAPRMRRSISGWARTRPSWSIPTGSLRHVTHVATSSVSTASPACSAIALRSRRFSTMPALRPAGRNHHPLGHTRSCRRDTRVGRSTYSSDRPRLIAQVFAAVSSRTLS